MRVFKKRGQRRAEHQQGKDEAHEEDTPPTKALSQGLEDLAQSLAVGLAATPPEAGMAEIEAALQQCRADRAAGRAVQETAQAHMARLDAMPMAKDQA